MHAVLGPVMVLSYGIWDIDGKPVTNKEGEPVEYVQVVDLDADEVSRYTLRGVNGDRPKELSSAVMVGDLTVARRGNDEGRVSEKLKFSVTGFEAAASAPRQGPPAKAA